MRTGLIIAIALAIALIVVAPFVANSHIEDDVAARTAASLIEAGNGWASVDAEGRTIVLAGNAPTTQMRDLALAIVARVAGVRAVTDHTTIEPPRDFAFSARRTVDRLTLSGEAPDQASVDLANAAARTSGPDVTIDASISIQPGTAHPGWNAAVDLAARSAALLFAGEASVTPDNVTIVGSVRDTASLESIEAMSARVARWPVSVEVTVATPRMYELLISRTADRLSITGEVPATAVRNALVDLARHQGIDRLSIDGLIIVPGVPTDRWQAMAGALIRYVSAMQSGEAELGPGFLTVSGVVADAAMAGVIQNALESVFGDDQAVALWIDIRAAGVGAAAIAGQSATAADAAALLEFARSAPTPAIDERDGFDAGSCQAALNLIVADETLGFLPERADLDPISQGFLEAAAVTIRRCPDVTIEISGHTDSDGDPEENETLSAARARAVIDYLVLRGVEPSRLVATGYGDQIPVADNATELGRSRNRRIEFLVEPPQQ